MTCIYLVLLLLYQGANTMQNECPVFGTNHTTPLSPFTPVNHLRGVYLNLQAPSQCTGMVTAWRFCYYIPPIFISSFEYRAVVKTYKQNNQMPNEYDAVSGSAKMVSFTFNQSQSNSFECFEQILTVCQQFQIRENHIIGACVWRVEKDILPLDLVGYNSSYENELLFQHDEENHGDCDNNRVNTIDIEDSHIVQRNQYVLHLYAVIDIPVAYTAGDNPPASQPSALIPGVYINTMSPVTCNGTITKFKYCYYPSSVSQSQVYFMIIGVWSYKEVNYNLNYIKNVTLNPVMTRAKIYCIEETVSSNLISVTTNDVIGVILPENPIPVLGTGDSSKYIMRSPDGFRKPEISNLLKINSTILHVQATIVETNSTSTVTTSRIVEEIYPTSMDMKSGTFLNETTEFPEFLHTTEAYVNESTIGGLAIIVVPIVIIVVCLVAGVTLLVVFLSIKQKYKMKKTSLPNGIDNCVYSLDEIRRHDRVTEPSIYLYEDPNELHQDNTKIAPIYSDPCGQDYEEPVKAAKYETPQSKALNSEEVTYSPPLDNIPTCEQNLNHVSHAVQCKSEDIYEAPANNEDAIYTSLRKRDYLNIPSTALIIGDIIGSGQFGVVHKGKWEKTQNKIIDIAVKMLQESCSQMVRIQYLQEAAVMAQFKHQNVIALYGVTEKDGIKMIVVELLMKGDLKEHLRSLKMEPKNSTYSSLPKLLLQFSRHICLGMNYLSSKMFVHRDLAARNILVSDNDVCKIADFGLSRRVEDDDYYLSRGGLVPVKWTAPEAIKYKKYTMASDVWSYGCVLYEIWSVGHKPFEDKRNMEILRILEKGVRLAPPPGCPRLLYEIMIQCWAQTPHERPSFQDILMSLMQKEDTVLNIPVNERNCSTQATILGAPLQAAHKMYEDLQKTYIPKQE